MTLHTPGPWKISLAGIIFAEPSPEDPQDTVTIVDAYSATPANARLIAAAPEMLENIKDTEAELAGILADPAGIPEPIVDLLGELANRQAVLLVRIEGKD